MRLRSLAVLTAVLFLASLSLAQVNMKSWDPIPASDLALKDNPKEPGARAMYLFHHAELTRSEYREHGAIKIFTDAGKDLANFQVGDGANKLQARTIAPDGRITEISKDEILKKLVAKGGGTKREAKVFAFPNVQAGSIVEYKYSYDLSPLDQVLFNWNLQDKLFSRETRIDLDSCYTKSYNRYLIDEYKQTNWQKVEMGDRLRYMATDVPAIPDEDFLPPGEEQRAHLFIMLCMQRVEDAKGLDLKTQEGQRKYVELFWKQQGEEVAKSYEGFLKKDRDKIDALKQSILASDHRDVRDWQKIYEYVIANFQNTSFERRSKEERDKIKKDKEFKDNSSLGDILNRKYGAQDDLVLLCTALLRSAGADARFALTRELDDGYFREGILFFPQLRSPLLVIKTAEGNVWLDPSTPYCQYGELPWQKQGVRAAVFNGKEVEYVDTPLLDGKKNRITRRLNLSLEGLKLKGKLVMQYSGCSNMERKNGLDDDSEDERRQTVKEYLETDIKGVDLQRCEFRNLTDFFKPLETEADFTTPELLVQTKSRLLVSPCILGKNQTRHFTSDKRVLPVFMGYPFVVEDDIRFQIPDGYECPELPAPQSFDSPFGQYSLSFQREGESIVCHRSFFHGKDLVNPEKYSKLKEFYDSARKLDETTVILRKKGA